MDFSDKRSRKEPGKLKLTGRLANGLLGATIFTMFVVYPFSSFGYVLPSPYIIEQMISGLDTAGQFEVKQTLHIIPDDTRSDNVSEPDSSFSYNQVLRYRLPGMFRSDISHEGFRHIHLSVPGGTITVMDEGVVSESEDWMYAYKELFSYRLREDVTEKLEEMGINVHMASLGRLDKTICYVIGAQYPDSGIPQLWVEKETFLPLRFVVTGAENNSGYPSEEIRFSGWRKYNGMRYPAEITFLKNGIFVQKIEVKNIDTRPAFKAGIFDIQAVESFLDEMEKSETEEDVSGDIRGEIEKFKKIFE